MLTFDLMSAANKARSEAPDGFDHRLGNWSLSDWMVATTGELGEAANVLKKLNRERDGTRGNRENERNVDDLYVQFMAELADTAIYLDLTATVARMTLGPDGFDGDQSALGNAIIAKFDATSERIGAPYRLGPVQGKTINAAVLAEFAPGCDPALVFYGDVSDAYLSEMIGMLENWRPNLVRAVDDVQEGYNTGYRDGVAVNEFGFSTAVRDVLVERRKQQHKGYDAEHDDSYTNAVKPNLLDAEKSSDENAYDDTSLRQAAALLATDPECVCDEDWEKNHWSWHLYQKHKAEPRAALVIAGALILAEIERLDRKAAVS